MGKHQDADQLLFRLLDTAGAPIDDPVPLPSSRGAASGRVPLVPTSDGWLLAWHQGGPEVRWQRLAADGTPLGDTVQATLSTGGLVALAEHGDGVEVVFDDNGVDGRIEGDTMGLHVAAIAPDGTVRDDRALSRSTGRTPASARRCGTASARPRSSSRSKRSSTPTDRTRPNHARS